MAVISLYPLSPAALSVTGAGPDWSYRVVVTPEGAARLEAVDTDDGEIYEFRAGAWRASGRNAAE